MSSSILYNFAGVRYGPIRNPFLFWIDAMDMHLSYTATNDVNLYAYES